MVSLSLTIFHGTQHSERSRWDHLSRVPNVQPLLRLSHTVPERDPCLPCFRQGVRAITARLEKRLKQLVSLQPWLRSKNGTPLLPERGAWNRVRNPYHLCSLRNVHLQNQISPDVAVSQIHKTPMPARAAAVSKHDALRMLRTAEPDPEPARISTPLRRRLSKSTRLRQDLAEDLVHRASSR